MSKKNKLKVRTRTFQEEATLPCPCGGTAGVGYEVERDFPMVIHSIPFCERFNTLGVIDYTTYLRKSRGIKLPGDAQH